MSHEEQAEIFAKSLLIAIRKFIDSYDTDPAKFPRWAHAANIRLGEVNGSTIIFFEQTPDDKDQIIEYRSVNSDVEFMFPQRTSSCVEGPFWWPENIDDEFNLQFASNLSLSISSPSQCFTNISMREKHPAFLFLNVWLRYEPKNQIEALRHVPFGLLISRSHMDDFQAFWEGCSNPLLSSILDLYDRAEYQSIPIAEKGVLASVDDTVIVLGSYKGSQEDELRQVRDRLIGLGYDAFLIKDLPENNEMSLPEKVRLWTTASRFCIMVDRDASGHIKEYEMVKSQRKPLILLRPENKGSTWMIGDDEIIDLNFIKTFEFTDSVFETIEDGVQWAEDLLHQRGKAYPEFYPWKKEQ
jgi:hypothetical protein